MALCLDRWFAGLNNLKGMTKLTQSGSSQITCASSKVRLRVRLFVTESEVKVYVSYFLAVATLESHAARATTELVYRPIRKALPHAPRGVGPAVAQLAI